MTIVAIVVLLVIVVRLARKRPPAPKPLRPIPSARPNDRWNAYCRPAYTRTKKGRGTAQKLADFHRVETPTLPPGLALVEPQPNPPRSVATAVARLRQSMDARNGQAG
ncbi:hypothetical protein [uncultured Thiodictyon sp.]|uniref:hypothetical protein n=1 Tax=uncultured Thiodictyon sp. TaxID=1846217 RepID=UPI0025FC1C78|nr:hypothetical protein [uncultured Thiodictyon sp.]